MKRLEPIECAAPFCTETFIPTNPNQIYCCRAHCNKANDMRKIENRKKIRLAKKAKEDLWDDINAYIKKVYEETGRLLSYGKAVPMMEQDRVKGGQAL